MKKFVVLSGGFHPFHAGHASLYQQAKQAFPDATVLVCATNVQTERPFPFELKKKLAQLSGVPSSNFIEVARQFSAEDSALLQRIGNLDDSIVIFARSDKDKNEQPQGIPLNPTKDKIPLVTRGPNKGKPQKLLDYNVNKNNLMPASKHTYMAYLKTVEFGPGITSASEIRKAWPTLNGKRKLAMVMSLYPITQQNVKLAQNVVSMFDQVMGSQDINENLTNDRILDTARRMIQNYKDSTYTAYERANAHAMNYESNEPGFKYWTQVADEIRKQTHTSKKKISEDQNSLLSEQILRRDVPNENWLQGKINYSIKKGRDRFGAPYFNATTAWFDNDIRVPIQILRKFPGMRGEQKNVRTADLTAIKKIMKNTGKLPLNNDQEYVPFIMVSYNGEAWVNEGNHRIMAAAELFDEGDKRFGSLPIELKYFDGGERVESGPLYPNKLVQQGVAEGKITKKMIHDLADRKRIPWDNEPNFLKLTKKLTGKEHLDDLNQQDLQVVQQYLIKLKESKSPLKEINDLVKPIISNDVSIAQIDYLEEN